MGHLIVRWYEVSIFFKGQQPQVDRATDSIPEHLHVLYENSIVYRHICMYYRISIFQKTAISILDSVVGLYRLFTTPLRRKKRKKKEPRTCPPFSNQDRALPFLFFSLEFSIQSIRKRCNPTKGEKKKFSAKRASFLLNSVNTELREYIFAILALHFYPVPKFHRISIEGKLNRNLIFEYPLNSLTPSNY